MKKIRNAIIAIIIAGSVLGSSMTVYAMDIGNEGGDGTVSGIGDSNGTESWDYTDYFEDATVEYKDFEDDNSEEPDMHINFDITSLLGGNGLFSSDGNMTLLDDIDGSKAEKLQFITVQTRSGAIFYIIIDRTTDKENVYFLNPVDAADLMALMDDKEKATLEDKNKEEVIKDTEVEDNTEEEKGKEKNNTSNPITTLLIFAILGGGGVGAYYFLKIKPGKGAKNNEDESEEYGDLDDESNYDDYDVNEDLEKEDNAEDM